MTTNEQSQGQQQLSRHRSTRRELADVVAPYVPPWCLAAAAGPAAAASHAEFGASPWAAVTYTAITTGLSAVTWRYSSKRSPIFRAHATATTAATGAWLTAATVSGLTPDSVKAWIFGSLLVGVSWNIRRGVRNSGTGESGGQADRSFLSAVGLAGTKIKDVQVETNRASGTFVVPGGEMDGDDVKNARKRIASKLSLGAGAVRVTVNGEHHDQAEVVVVPVDVLKQTPAYPGPSAPGATMVAPLVLGIYEDMRDLVVYGAADPKAKRNLAHWLIVGTTGAGKGGLARNAVAEIGTRRESTLWMIDTVKQYQTFGCAADMIDWFATDKAQAEAMMACLPDVIAARTSYLGSRGLDTWVPGCGLNHLTVWIEEAQAHVRDDQEFTDAVAAARSAGVFMVISLYRCTHNEMPTSLRSLINNVSCCGVRDDIDGEIALGSEVVTSGANPAAWGNKFPGYNYTIGLGIDEARATVVARSFGDPFTDPETGAEALRKHLADWAHVRDEIDPVTMMAAGNGYASRKGRPGHYRQIASGLVVPEHVVQDQAPVNAAGSPVTAVDAVPPGFSPAGGDQGGNAAARAAFFSAAPTEVDDDTPLPEFPVRLAGAFQADTDPSGRELAEPEEMSHEPNVFAAALAAVIAGDFPELGDSDDEEPGAIGTGEPVSTEVARAALLAMIDELDAAEVSEVSPKDLGPFLATIGRSGGWVQGELKRLVSEGRLSKDKYGRYRIRPSARVLAGAGV